MKTDLSIYIAQLNQTVGAVTSNCEKIADIYAQGVVEGADLILTPELSVTGYPLEDLVLKPDFVQEAMAAADALAEITYGDGAPGLIVGSPWLEEGKLYNASLLLDGGTIKEVRFKHELPNYGVFDEKRVFDAGPLPLPIKFRGHKLGIMICEDMWFKASAEALEAAGAEILLVPTCSPFQIEKHSDRQFQAKRRVSETGLPLIFCNQICGQDELVFDGGSYVIAADGSVPVQMRGFEEDTLLTHWTKDTGTMTCETKHQCATGEPLEVIYQALVLGLRDYVNKNHFPGVILGLSGGIDSALTAAIAVDALGAEKVHCVMMPSRYTSDESVGDAQGCAKALGVRYDTIPIKPGIDALTEMLGPIFAETTPDTTEENIQSRLRGLTLMALSNKFGDMLLTTGNKSEMSVGYATLYGDMCGGYNALKDVYKLDVFALGAFRNTCVPAGSLGPSGEVIPVNIINKPPSAELRDDQKDEDSLPPYERLDDMLRGLVDEDLSASAVSARGHAPSEVARIEHLLYIAEYKRRQAPPGVKITRKNFGRDRRYPITNGYRSAGKDK